MSVVKNLVLDVLKPHHPDAITFARTIAEVGPAYTVKLLVVEMDEHTESLQLEIAADAIDFEAVLAAIQAMGGSLHSIDEVEVTSDPGEE